MAKAPGGVGSAGRPIIETAALAGVPKFTPPGPRARRG